MRCARPAARVPAVPRIRELKRARASRSQRLVDVCGLAAGLVGPEQPEHRAWLELVRQLLRIRHEVIVPRLAGIRGHAGSHGPQRQRAAGRLDLADGSTLELIANLADRLSPVTPADKVAGEVLFANRPDLPASCAPGACRRGRCCGCCTRAS